MPRENKPPRVGARPNSILSPQKSPMKIPLNDDREEKAVRFQSRQALQEIHLNSIKAAASPVRKQRMSLTGQENGSPRTPNSQDKDIAVVGGGAATPMKRVPILANFEEWMKMATDNKINATNSWNFALIDYFHDMSLLREGDSVNFQKASCTLDGCVKIYTSRVDSVATETGKLLSGLADSGNKKRKGDGEDGTEGEEDDEEEEGEDGVKRKAKKRVQRSSEATLAPSFAQLQLKKMELEFSVDPLFKKASADFDEGGAKGLLLNHLTIDSEGRIVFDSSDDVNEEESTLEGEEALGESSKVDQKLQEPEETDVDIDLASLGLKFFPDLSKLDQQDICPSLKTFELGGTSDSLDIPFLKAPEDWKKDQNQSQEQNEGMDARRDGIGFDDDDDGNDLGGFTMAEDVGFGEGGEAWAKEAAIDSRQPRPFNNAFDGNEDSNDPEDVGSYNPDSAHYGVSLNQGKDAENILAYFDQALSKNWAGPEHWRIRKIKDINKPSAPTAKRKEKEPFEINFAAPLSKAMADMLYTPASTNSAICLPKTQWKSKSRNLLPDDKHFNSRQLLSLFLKPKARIGSRRLRHTNTRSGDATHDDEANGEMDGAFWAKQNQASIEDLDAAGQALQGNYDPNFFADDALGAPDTMGDDDDEFADAQERFSPGVGDGSQTQINSLGHVPASQEDGNGFGTQLVTQSRRLRPEYVQYARVAKKVDVRRLKEEMWRGIGFEGIIPPQKQQETPPPESTEIASALDSKDPNSTLKFTSVMNNLQSVYPKQAMDDISTSYCFICLLHLANEKGLTLANDEVFQEISIKRDWSAEITGEGE